MPGPAQFAMVLYCACVLSAWYVVVFKLIVICDRYMQGRSGSLGMPERFTDASLWRWRRKYEHPVYMTSNNVPGAKPPSQQMLPLSWHGAKGEFTRTYIKAEIRTGNFSTGLPTSRNACVTPVTPITHVFTKISFRHGW